MSYFFLNSHAHLKNLRANAVRCVFCITNGKFHSVWKCSYLFSIKRQCIWLDCFVDNELKNMESFIFPLRKSFVFWLVNLICLKQILVNNYLVHKYFVKLHHHRKPRHAFYDGSKCFRLHWCCLLHFSTFFYRVTI